MDDLDKGGASGGAGGVRRDNLEYLADLLGELQQMAEREGCRTLSRLLAISHAEAQRETRREGP